jgi:hypothetical protein
MYVCVCVCVCVCVYTVYAKAVSVALARHTDLERQKFECLMTTELGTQWKEEFIV